MKKLIFLILIAGLLWGGNVRPVFPEQLPAILNIGTHPIGSFFNVVGTAVATVVGKNTSMKTTVKPMAGPSA